MYGRRRMAFMIEVIRGRLGTGRGIFIEDRSTGALVCRIFDSVARRIAHYLIKEFSPKAERETSVFKLRLHLSRNLAEFGIQVFTDFTERGNGGRQHCHAKTTAANGVESP